MLPMREGRRGGGARSAKQGYILVPRSRQGEMPSGGRTLRSGAQERSGGYRSRSGSHELSSGEPWTGCGGSVPGRAGQA